MNDATFRKVRAGAAARGTVFTCSLCGERFTHGGQTCGACPLSAGCEVVSCPSCGHSFPRRSWIVASLRRLFGRPEDSRW